MKILIVEDDNNKIKHLKDFISTELQEWQLDVKKSYQAGLKSVLNYSYDIIILDMSLPTFDTSPTEDGYKFRPFGGKEILEEMKRKNIYIPTIVFTQFESFGEGSSFTVLEALNAQLSTQFSETYMGTVYYSASESTWKAELKKVIGNINRY